VALAVCKRIAYIRLVIRTFRDKALADLWAGRRTKIDARLHKRILFRLVRLDLAKVAPEMDHPGFDFHTLRGYRPARYTVHVNGPWCLTFEFEDGNAYDVDFEQYHDR
jgi:proteic killer suppression protein